MLRLPEGSEMDGRLDCYEWERIRIMNIEEFLDFLESSKEMGLEKFKAGLGGVAPGNFDQEGVALEVLEAMFYEGDIEAFWRNAESIVEKFEYMKSLGLVGEDMMENVSCCARVVATESLHAYFLGGMDIGANELVIIDLALNRPTYESEVAEANPDVYMKRALANYWSLQGSEELNLERVRGRLGTICRNAGYKVAQRKAAEGYIDAMLVTVAEKRTLEEALREAGLERKSGLGKAVL